VIEALRGKDVLLGVIDVGNEAVESPEAIAQRTACGAALYRSGPSLCLHGLRYAAAVPQGGRGQLRALAAGAALVNAAR
jgi:hypothetical protein